MFAWFGVMSFIAGFCGVTALVGAVSCKLSDEVNTIKKAPFLSAVGAASLAASFVLACIAAS